jgi:hypothetical protein
MKAQPWKCPTRLFTGLQKRNSNQQPLIIKPFTMTTKIMAALCIVLFSAASCKKETQESSFKPDGFWRGNAYVYHVGILNKPDGSSRLYYRIFGLDTAGATIGDGIYSMNGNYFKAEYNMTGGNGSYKAFVESTSLSDDEMTGQIFFSATPDIIDFTLRKK